MPFSATGYSEKAAKSYMPESLIKHPYVFCLAMYSAGSVRTIRSYNPAKAYTLCKGVVEMNYPVSITLWLKVGADYMMPLFYTATSVRDLDKAFKAITFDMANADNLCKK